MTLREIIQQVDTVKPNSYPMVTKILWLSEVETMIQTQILLLDTPDIVIYGVTTPPDTEVILDADAMGLYTSYLMSMVDWYNGDYDRYNNAASMFNARFGDYMRRYASRLHDSGKGIVLSAYAIACKHGFTGSEEEWLASLRACPEVVEQAGSPLQLQDGVLYHLHDVTELEMCCPEGHHSCELILELAAAGTVSLSVFGNVLTDDMAYLGAQNGEIWEISVLDGCVRSGCLGGGES